MSPNVDTANEKIEQQTPDRGGAVEVDRDSPARAPEPPDQSVLTQKDKGAIQPDAQQLHVLSEVQKLDEEQGGTGVMGRRPAKSKQPEFKPRTLPPGDPPPYPAFFSMGQRGLIREIGIPLFWFLFGALMTLIIFLNVNKHAKTSLQTPTFGFVDVNLIHQALGAEEIVNKKLEEEIKDPLAQRNELVRRYNTELAERKQNFPENPSVEETERLAEFQRQEQQRIAQIDQALSQQVTTARARLLKQFNETQVRPMLNLVAREKKLLCILPLSNTLWSSPAVDVTNDVLVKLRVTKPSDFSSSPVDLKDGVQPQIEP